MFKGLGDLGGLLKQAQQLQGRMQEMQAQLGNVVVTGSAGGDMVTVEADGLQRIRACRIEPDLLAGADREMLEELIVAATNQALEKAKQASAEQMSELAGGLPIPGLSNMLSQFGAGGPPG